MIQIQNLFYNNSKGDVCLRATRLLLISGGTSLYEATGDVPLDGVAFSRLDRL